MGKNIDLTKLSCCNECELFVHNIYYLPDNIKREDMHFKCLEMTRKEIIKKLGYNCVYASMEKRSLRKFEKDFERKNPIRKIDFDDIGFCVFTGWF